MAQNKILEGIKVTDSLLECWKDALSMASSDPQWASLSEEDKDGEGIRCPDSLFEAVKMLKVTKDLLDRARNGDETPKPMPIPVLKSIQIVYRELGHGSESSTKTIKLEESLQKSSLVFTAPKSKQQTLESQAKFQRRMDRLRLQLEATKYSKLTNNLQDHRSDDDITAKSMTFAASVGLNMIIAPLSFGCFMYFFAGGIFDFFFSGDGFDSSKQRAGGTDIKRVIVGVVSGVIMMIIEMLLFVIRTHEFEEHSRKKKKKKGVEPFGVYSKNTPATYTDGKPRTAGTELAGMDSTKKSR
jgi:hypothetical protein